MIFFRRFPRGGRYLVGVSGGRDSVALLHWLFEHGYDKLIVCHLNHRLRGRASDADAEFVKKLVAGYQAKLPRQAVRLASSKIGRRKAWLKTSIVLEHGAADVGARAKEEEISIELAAREARYKFFAQVAKRKRCRTIFLGHQADDLVETFLINLFRGSGAAGLAGMREISSRRIEGIELTIVRPFLAVWRSDIDKYVAKHRLKFREDASNMNLAPLRNRIRRRIVPYLEKVLGRNIRQSIWRAAAISAEEENWIDGQLPGFSGLELSAATLRQLPIALQRRQILKWLRHRKIANVGFDAVERVRSLLDHESGIAKVNLPQGRHVRRRAGKIFID